MPAVAPRLLKALSASFAVLLLGVLVDWDWVRVYNSDVDVVLGLLFAVGAASSWFASQKPMSAPYTAETLSVASGIGVLLLFVSGNIGFAIVKNPVSLSAVALLLVAAVSLQVAIALARAETLRLQPTDDVTYGLALAGAAAILLSLFALSWFTTEGRDGVTVKFRDFVDVYDAIVREEGSVGGIRLFYLEWGYVVSLIASIAVAAVAVRGRKNPMPANVPLKWFVVGLTVLVGVWQLFLLLGMRTIEDGSVGAGPWIGVIGHGLTVAATLRLASIKFAKATSAAS